MRNYTLDESLMHLTISILSFFTRSIIPIDSFSRSIRSGPGCKACSRGYSAEDLRTRESHMNKEPWRGYFYGHLLFFCQ